MTKKSSKNKSNKKLDITEIEELVDKIIEKHKVKVENLHLKEIEAERFLLKNKEGSNIYYLRKSKKKSEDFEEISDKIISEARSNLGVEPLEKKEEIQAQNT